MSYYRKTNISDHIDDHNKPLGHERSQTFYVGTISADTDRNLWTPENDGLNIRRAFFVIDDDMPANSTNYWTILLYANNDQNRQRPLVEWDGSSRGFLTSQISKVPVQGNLDLLLNKEVPLRVKITKTGTPDPLDQLSIQLVLGIQ